MGLNLADLKSMLVQVTLLSEGAITARTDVVLAVGVVYQQVRSQVGLVGEGAVAADVRAAIGSFSSMRAHVALEQPRA